MIVLESVTVGHRRVACPTAGSLSCLDRERQGNPDLEASCLRRPGTTADGSSPGTTSAGAARQATHSPSPPVLADSKDSCNVF